jgi:hypothetical protein
MIVLLCHERSGASFCHRSSGAVTAQSRGRRVLRHFARVPEADGTIDGRAIFYV